MKCKKHPMGIACDVDGYVGASYIYPGEEHLAEIEFTYCPVCGEPIGKPDVLDAYPDGWTCIVCGKEYHGVYPADIEEGTMCKKCL